MRRKDGLGRRRTQEEKEGDVTLPLPLLSPPACSLSGPSYSDSLTSDSHSRSLVLILSPLTLRYTYTTLSHTRTRTHRLTHTQTHSLNLRLTHTQTHPHSVSHTQAHSYPDSLAPRHSQRNVSDNEMHKWISASSNWGSGRQSDNRRRSVEE